MPKKIAIFDSTLRDGAQAEGISFSVEDKLKIVKALNDLGISYIEAGNPGSNPKDIEFFYRMRENKLIHAKLTAFGSTRRKGIRVEDDTNLQSILRAKTPAVAIVGKSWDFHVSYIIKTSLEDNLQMIRETVAFFKEKGKEVIFDAEHFFDGFKSNPDYALEALQAAVDGGSDWLVLCETNGGALPNEVYEITKNVVNQFSVPIGIHCHDDSGTAVANSIMAVEAGATQVQGTFLGFGERCGNANLSTIIPSFQLKKKLICIPEDQMTRLTSAARYIAEISNITLNGRLPYVGKSAFAHKGGMHIDGVIKEKRSFEHIPPEEVGNERRFLMSEVSGRSTILKIVQKINPELNRDSPKIEMLVRRLKDLEHEGYQFEAAENSFELMVRKQLDKYYPFFKLDHFTIIEKRPPQNGEIGSSATIKITVGENQEITAAEGNGPVNALDKALRRALEVFYPGLKDMHLTDFKVRVLNPKEATAAKVRVLIESTDGRDVWTTVGVSTDIIEASWIALADSIEFKLMKDFGKDIKNLSKI